MEERGKANAEVGRELDHISDKIDHKEYNAMFGIEADSLLDPEQGAPTSLGSFGRVFHGDTANAWRYTEGMLPGKRQRYLDHPEYRDHDNETHSDIGSLSDLQLPPER